MTLEKDYLSWWKNVSILSSILPLVRIWTGLATGSISEEFCFEGSAEYIA